MVLGTFCSPSAARDAKGVITDRKRDSTIEMRMGSVLLKECIPPVADHDALHTACRISDEVIGR
jgi:hypothetical protein